MNIFWHSFLSNMSYKYFWIFVYVSKYSYECLMRTYHILNYYLIGLLKWVDVFGVACNDNTSPFGLINCSKKTKWGMCCQGDPSQLTDPTPRHRHANYKYAFFANLYLTDLWLCKWSFYYNGTKFSKSYPATFISLAVAMILFIFTLTENKF